MLYRMDKGSLESLSEEDVVALAQQGDDCALSYLLDKYKESVRHKSRSFYLVGGEPEDVVQEGMIGLFKAVRDYNPEKNASFKTFAELCITRHIISAVKSATRQKHVPLNYYVSLNKGDSSCYYEATALCANADPEQLIIEQENVAVMECGIDQMLSSLEARVLMYHLQGINYNRIAQMLGRTPKSVDNALQRIKRKIENYINAAQ